MNARDRFIEIFKTKIKREGADKLLEFIMSPSSDFFVAPASARYHSAYEGGLCDHSLNVYDCLCAYLDRPVAKEKYGLNVENIVSKVEQAMKSSMPISVAKEKSFFKKIKEIFK